MGTTRDKLDHVLYEARKMGMSEMTACADYVGDILSSADADTNIDATLVDLLTALDELSGAASAMRRKVAAIHTAHRRAA